ncbi:MAG: type I-U CRISPR-associated protein Csx17, partial [Actinomycetia bacterium]|nr:type I-U CRISPR-associated protein Csx17 [Actinomycetes bacterium]
MSTTIPLGGCRSTPLGSYLTAMGILRAVSRLLDPIAAGHWERGRFVLTTAAAADVESVVDLLVDRFEPLPIVSPWNAGSGFAGNGRNVAAEKALDQARMSHDPRLGDLQAAIRAGDRVVAEGRARGWSGAGGDLWDGKRKADVLALCRVELPDAALAWLDTAVALGQGDDPAFSRLLGTGGNFGRQDLSATYLSRVHTAMSGDTSSAWLRATLTGEESVPYLRDAVGQFDPGRAGGIQSS